MWYLSQTHRFLNRFTLIGRFTPILIGYLKHESNIALSTSTCTFASQFTSTFITKIGNHHPFTQNLQEIYLKCSLYRKNHNFQQFLQGSTLHCEHAVSTHRHSYCVHNTMYCLEFINYIYHLSSKALFKTLGRSQLPMCRTQFGGRCRANFLGHPFWPGSRMCCLVHQVG